MSPETQPRFFKTDEARRRVQSSLSHENEIAINGRRSKKTSGGMVGGGRLGENDLQFSDSFDSAPRVEYRRSVRCSVLIAFALFAMFSLFLAFAVSCCAPARAAVRKPVDLHQTVEEIPSRFR